MNGLYWIDEKKLLDLKGEWMTVSRIGSGSPIVLIVIKANIRQHKANEVHYTQFLLIRNGPIRND